MGNEPARRHMTEQEARAMTRRGFVASLGALGASSWMPASASAAPGAAPIRTLAFNHVALAVSDIERSVDFYRRIFGMPVQAYGWGGAACLAIGKGPQFLMLMKAPDGAKPFIRHIGFAVANFDPARIVKTLKDGGADARVEMRAKADGGGGPGAPDGTPEVIFMDPDNFPMQLQHAAYKGGGGIHGEIALKSTAPAGKPPISVVSINHCTMFVADQDRTFDFYRKHFDMPWQVSKEITVVGAPLLIVGPAGPRPVHMGLCAISRPNQKPEINHACLGVPNFDHDAILKTLNELGLKSGPGVSGPMTARLTYLKGNGGKGSVGPAGGPALGGPPGGTPEIYLSDPDGISIQLQDASFCGEANAARTGACPA